MGSDGGWYRCFWASQMLLVVKNPPANAGDTGLIPGLAGSPGVGNCNVLQYSGLGKSHGQRCLVDYRPWGLKRVGHD